MILPVTAVLPDLAAALRARSNAVLIAPPGAGKTTAVAPALLDEPWCDGRILILSPRRVAARAAAERMAELAGEKPGERFGYLTRMDSRVSKQTRVVVMTEAIFVSTILADPELAGVSAVLFDEAHERHVDSDLGLALAIEAQQVLRPDLRLVVMSATIDGARFAGLLGADTPLIESAGRSHPLTIRWLGARPELRIEQQMAEAIRIGWRETDGSMLAFLPGVREIERTAERLAGTLPDALVLPLHGQGDAAAQRRALRRDAQGRRRIVLATSIAETSLTLDGVSVVVDSGLARRPEYDRGAGITRLVTQRVSRAAADQRAGRAARQGPGICYRLWPEAAHGGLPPYDPPGILAADAASLLLTLAQWGTQDPSTLRWLDAPPPAAVTAAREDLRRLDALDPEGRITETGLRLGRLPLEPPLAAMLLFAARHGAADAAARIALLLQERGLGGGGEDLTARLSRWNGDQAPRARSARALATRWARQAEALVAGEQAGVDDPPPPGILLAAAFPHRVARRRDVSGEQWLSAGGRGLRLDPASALTTSEWLAVGSAQGVAAGARIIAALPIDAADVPRWLDHRMERRHELRWKADGGRIEAMVELRLGAIVLSAVPDPDPDEAQIAHMLGERVRQLGLGALPLGASTQALLQRANYAGVASLSEDALLADVEAWLAPLLGGARSLSALSRDALHDSLRARLDHAARRALERRAPAQFATPAGTTHPIDYADDRGPSVAVRVQALFGLATHPVIGSPPVPLLLELTSPAGRPIQATRDLPGFWRGSWAEVRREMKGRYPKHRWPERPWEEEASLKTRNAFERR